MVLGWIDLVLVAGPGKASLMASILKEEHLYTSIPPPRRTFPNVTAPAATLLHFSCIHHHSLHSQDWYLPLHICLSGCSIRPVPRPRASRAQVNRRALQVWEERGKEKRSGISAVCQRPAWTAKPFPCPRNGLHVPCENSSPPAWSAVCPTDLPAGLSPEQDLTVPVGCSGRRSHGSSRKQ